MAEFNVNLRSKILCGPTDVTVILPDAPLEGEPKEFYESGKKYKVLWLLHGGVGDRTEWIHNTNVARYCKERGIIAVIPNALNSDFANHPEFADGYLFQDFFFEELMPFVYNWLPVSKAQEDNFLAGYSMGGAGTWMYGLEHPEKFAAIAPLSSPPRNYDFLEEYRTLTSAQFRDMVMADRKKFPSGYGNPKNGMLIKEVNMIAKYPSVGDFLDSYECTWARYDEFLAAGKSIKAYVGCGKEDRGYTKIVKFREHVENIGAEGITFDLIEGYGHDHAYWDYAMTKVMDFFGL